MAYQGAKVIHPRAVEIAMQAKVPIRIRSTYSEGLGTLVTSVNKESQGSDIRDRLVTGIAHVPKITQIKVRAKKINTIYKQKFLKQWPMPPFQWIL